MARAGRTRLFAARGDRSEIGSFCALFLDATELGWGQSASYPYQEGSFFGNIFTSPPTMYYCDGKDFAVGVHDRLGL